MKKTIILMALLILPTVYATTNLTNNETYLFTYNGTGNETFYCANPETNAFCGFQNLTINLTEGSTVVRTGSYSYIEATCISDNNASNKCVVSDNIKPGETLKIQTASCDLEIKAKETSNTCDVEEVKHEEFITFDFVNDLISVKAGNQTFDIDPRTDTLEQIKHRVTYTCPYVLDKNDLLADDQVINTCKTLLPALGASFVNTTGACLDAMVKTNEIISDRSEDVRSITEENGRLRTEIEIAHQKIEILENVTQTARQEASNALALASVEKDQKNIFILLTAMLFVAVALMTFYLFGGGVRE